MVNKEIEAVKKIPAYKRYQYFIKKVVDYEEIWGLNKDGWAISEDEKGNKLFPIWPTKDFAVLCSIEDWKEYRPSKIGIDDFINNWIPGLTKDSLKISVFWNNHDSIVIEPIELLKDLEEELEKY